MCCRFFRSRWKIGRRCSLKSSRAKAAADLAKEISKRCLNRSNWNRRDGGICSHAERKSEDIGKNKDRVALSVRIRQRVRQRGGRRCPAARAECSAKSGSWLVHGATERHGVYGAARGESPDLALPDAAIGGAQAVRTGQPREAAE